MENRLTKDRRLMEYPQRYVGKKINHRSVPYRNYIEHFAAGSSHAVFFKKATDASVSRTDLDTAEFPEGWDLHVVYFQNVSVFEAYRRNGAGLTDAEVNALLAQNQGNSFWKRVNRREQPQVWGCDFVLEDGTLMAFRQGNFLVFYRPEFEQIARDSYNTKRESVLGEQEADAPSSVLGF